MRACNFCHGRVGFGHLSENLEIKVIFLGCEVITVDSGDWGGVIPGIADCQSSVGGQNDPRYRSVGDEAGVIPGIGSDF